MFRIFVLSILILLGVQARALELSAPFDSIDGGTLSLAQWQGQPVLVVNTASQCGFTYQYRGLQDLYDRYRDRGLVVLAVPSDDFRQELASNAEVKEFCELQYGIDMPMTGITHVKGARAHPFYKSLRAETGFVPGWNFNKVLIGPDGQVVKTYGSGVKPLSRAITGEIEALLK
ncbi:glutathione peroxidase [Marimonas arenosa]|uniref:Glutathione peroxidase n=1 Tax=Marimonas arenosa TaxID=1795305 RepID=A0AAE3WG28_9RHOB|nr:glutathione peroxidase [Marimonas arenosa]MDQ2090988.1 glutathione peroxidase [Marimonas arenosa]